MMGIVPLSHCLRIMKLTSKLIKSGNLSTAGLELEWRPFYEFVKSTTYSGRDGATHSPSNQVITQHAKEMKALCVKARHYFTPNSFGEILDELLPFCSPHDIYYNRSVSLLGMLLPVRQHWVPQQLREYKVSMQIDTEFVTSKLAAHGITEQIPDFLVFVLDEVLHETVWVSTMPACWLLILCKLISYNREFGVFLRPFLPELFHHLYLDVAVPIDGSHCVLKKQNRLKMGSILQKNHAVEVQVVVELLVLIMDHRGEEDPVQQHFVSFFEDMTNYYNPDENRRTTSFTLKLTAVLNKFVMCYSSRFWRELRGYPNDKCAAYKDIDDALKRDVYSWYADVNRDHPLYRPLDDQFKLKVSAKTWSALQPIVRYSIYAKSGITRYGGFAAIQTMASVFPVEVTKWAMPEISECLSSITQSHRLAIGIGLLDAVTPTMVNRYLLPQDVQTQFANSLETVLFGIDPSLSKQCAMTMAYLETVFSSVPMISAKDKSYEVESNELTQAKSSGSNLNVDENGIPYNDDVGRRSTYCFEPFALSFCTKILEYARDSSTSLDALKSSGSANATPGIRDFRSRGNKVLLSKFRHCVFAFWFSVSTEIYTKCRDRVLKAVIPDPQCGSLGALIITGMISAHPELSLNLCLPAIIGKVVFVKNGGRLELDEGDMGVYQPEVLELRGSKEVLQYYLGLMEAAIVVAHSQIIPYIPVLCSTITLCINSTLPEIKKFAGPLLQALVTTLVRETPLEVRSFSPDRWKEDGSWKHWRDWGQFSEIEMKELQKTWRPDLKLKWFYATKREFEAVQQVMDLALSEPLKQIEAFITEETPSVTAEQLLEYVRVLYYFCYGLGHLGDFDVDKSSELLSSIKEERYYAITQRDDYFSFQINKSLSDPVYGTLNTLRSMLRLPNGSESGPESESNVSLRTALARLSIRLYQKLGQFSDTADYVMEDIQLPDSMDTDAVDRVVVNGNGTTDNDVEMSDVSNMSSFSNINLTDMVEVLKTESLASSSSEESQRAAALRKSKLFPGVSKVLVWLNTFVNAMLNHDGVQWGVVRRHYSMLAASPWSEFELDDITTGHKYPHRPTLVYEAEALTLKRLYFLYQHNAYTTDVRLLVAELTKCSISEFENVRTQAIRALISPRSIHNFRAAIEWALMFWIRIVGDAKSQKTQLLGAAAALGSSTLIEDLVLQRPRRHREFVSAILGCSMHPEPLVQAAISQNFFTYFSKLRFRTLNIAPSLAQGNASRQKEMDQINDSLRQEHALMQQELLRIAQREREEVVSEDDAKSEDALSESYVKIPPTPNDPVVMSLASLVDNLDLTTLKIDIANLTKILSNPTPQSLSLFLKQQGFQLPPTLFSSLSAQQLQSIIDNSKLSQFIKKKVPSLSDVLSKVGGGHSNNSHNSQRTKRVVVHWKYQLMASILLWKSLRPNMAPTMETVQYFLNLIHSDVPSLNRVALSSLSVIVRSYIPRLHYKDVLKDSSRYPMEHTFGFRKCFEGKVSIHDLIDSLPRYMLPRATLTKECADMVHAFCTKNMDIIFEAFVDNHPHLRSADPVQNRRSSDTQLTNLVAMRYLWPYDGYEMTLEWWEHRHHMLCNHLLRCKWPDMNADDQDISKWTVDGGLWIHAVEQMTVHGLNVKEKEHQLAAAEGVAGILRAYHHFAGIGQLPDGISKEWLCSKVVQPLLKVMMQCPQESEDAWCCALRAGLANCDPRNVEWMTRPVLEMMVRTVGNDKISPEKQVRAIRYGTEILLSFGYRGRTEWQYILDAVSHGPGVKWPALDGNHDANGSVNGVVTKSNGVQSNGVQHGKDENTVNQMTAFNIYLCNPYRSIRSDIGILLSVLVRCVRTESSPLLSVYDCTATERKLESLLECIDSECVKLWNLQKEEEPRKNKTNSNGKDHGGLAGDDDADDDDEPFTKKYNQLLQTLCFWSLQCYNHCNVVFLQSLMVRMIPLLLYGSSREDTKTKELVQMTTRAIAWTPFQESQTLAILDAVLDVDRTPKLINNPSWKLRDEVLKFLLAFCARNAIVLDHNEKYVNRIVDYLSGHSLKDKQLEVRMTARNVLTALIQSTRLKDAEHIGALQQRFEKLARTKVPKRNFETVDSGFEKKVGVKLRKKHCGILGLSALVLSCPYTVPEWLPDVLSFIAMFERERAPIGTTCKKTVGEFKRTHQDEWHLFKKQFTLDQLSSIQDASSNSYFV